MYFQCHVSVRLCLNYYYHGYPTTEQKQPDIFSQQCVLYVSYLLRYFYPLTQAAMIDQWRKHFVLTESMLEMECTCLTPAVVLQTSGHVERFTDLMVKDPETGECFRADKLLEDAIDALIESSPDMPKEEREDHLRIQRQADAYSPEEIDDLLANKYNCKAPSGQPYSNAFPFNLMFKTSIGPEGTAVGYLRPETAQGLFVNFRRLLDANAGKMPFAAAQIGLGFRNGECACKIPFILD